MIDSQIVPTVTHIFYNTSIHLYSIPIRLRSSYYVMARRLFSTTPKELSSERKLHISFFRVLALFITTYYIFFSLPLLNSLRQFSPKYLNSFRFHFNHISFTSSPVQSLCDPEPSDDHDSMFITQKTPCVAETQLDEEDSQDLLSSPEDRTSHADADNTELSQSQKTLLSQLVQHRLQIINHNDRAAQFHLFSELGTSLPKYTKPMINLRDQQFFSATTQSKLDSLNFDYQKQLCSILHDHHKDMVDRSELMLKFRLDSITRLYKDQALTRRLSKLSKQESLESYTSSLARQKRNPRSGDKRPHS